MNAPLTRILRHARLQAGTLLLLVACLWGTVVLQKLLKITTGYDLTAWGIAPRHASGLIGVILAPLLHADFHHVAANTVPLVVFAALLLLEGQKRFWQATMMIVFAGGLAVWLVGNSQANYVGASGLVFGYQGYIFMRAWLTRKPLWIGVAVVCALYYGGIAANLITGIGLGAWLPHATGFIAGMLAAQWQHRHAPKPALVVPS
jgi:membrane associated rhomboid family serine protease